jgi:hypothetical protein
MTFVVSIIRSNRVPVALLALTGLALLTAGGCGRSAPAQTASDDGGKSGAVPQDAAAPSSVDPTPDPRLALAASAAAAQEAGSDEIEAIDIAEAKAIRAAQAAQQPTTIATSVRAEPETLDLGDVTTNTQAKGTVRLVNVSDHSVTIADCKTNCGCTTTNCPKGKALAPGESADVEVSVSTGTAAHKITKQVTFIVDGEGQVRLPVQAQVIEFVTIEPNLLDPDRPGDGKITLRATDGQAFSIVGVAPGGVIEQIPAEPATEHVLALDWEQWEAQAQIQGKRTTLVFNLDHPKATKVQTYVRPRRTTPTRQETAANLRQQGVVDAPLSRPDGEARLAVEISRGDVEALRKALTEVTDQTSKDAALALAARQGNVEAIRVLYEAGASISAQDRLGRTALMSAVQSRTPNAEVVRALISMGANPNARDTQEGTALARAAGPFGDAETIRVLVEAGADVNAADRNGMTPLMWAARFGSAEKVKALIAAGARLDARDGQGMGPADYARQRPGADGQGAAIARLLGAPAEGKASAGTSGESTGG